MKLIFKIFGILVLILIIAMITIPYFFRDQIVEVVKEEINKNVNAKVDFEDFNLSLFRSFPNFDFQLMGLSVINKAPFEGDTLAYMPAFGLTLDLMSVFRGEAYELKKVTIDRPVVYALVTDDGAANWDIAIESEGAENTDPEGSSSDEAPFLIKLRSVVIKDAKIVYDDKSLTTYTLLEGVDHSLSGDFTLDFTNLNTHTSVRELTVIYDGVKYFNKIDAVLDAEIGADLVNSIYTLKNNELRLNNLFVEFEGNVGMQENGDINMMLTYSSKKSEFKNFLSLIPAIYSKDFEGLEASGTVSLSGNVKGIYNDLSYPAFALNLLIKDGRFQYPDLPKSVDKVNVDTRIAYPGGDFDNLSVDVPIFKFSMAENDFAASLSIKKPMTDIYMNGKIDGSLDLGKVKEFYPMEQDEELAGKITSNVSFEGNMSALENEKYDEFTFLGFVLLEDFSYASGLFPEKMNITKAQLNFSPEYLDLVSFGMTVGRNNIFAKGKIENFIPYAFADGTLLGNLETSSSYLNLSDFIPADEAVPQDSLAAESEPITNDSTSTDIIEIPGNIGFNFTADYKKVIYDNIELNDLVGKMSVNNSALILEKLDMAVLDGSLSMSGKYDTKDPANPFADMNFSLQNIDIKKACNTFGTIEKFAPIAQKTEGEFSTSFKLTTSLGKDLMPVYSSMNGGGNLQTTSITIENVNSIDKLADLLKMPDLKKMLLSPINLSFEFINGKLHVKPFDIKYQDITANIVGWTSFDQTINYDMVMTLPRSKFGGQANAILDNLVNEANKMGTSFSMGETINLKAGIVGTVTDPKVQVFPGEGSGKNMMDDLKKKAQDELNKQKQILEQEARQELEKKKAEAKKEADKIIADATKQADRLIADAQQQADAINKTANESADQIKKEAQKQAENVMAEAKKNGPLAELAAKATTEKLISEANQQAGNIVKEAEKRSADIMNAAKKNASKIKLDAQTKADNLLK
ncbi:MAG: hypothetical protein K9H16_01600 [Bacteroidales bacterium]|nr:hypothetical protein [Bacteroidales bacterium]